MSGEASNDIIPGAEAPAAPPSAVAAAASLIDSAYIPKDQATRAWQHALDMGKKLGNNELIAQAEAGAKAAGISLISDHSAHAEALAQAKIDAGQASIALAAAPPAQADRYNLNYTGTPVAMNDPPEALAKFDGEMQSGFHKMELAAGLGQPLLDAYMQARSIYSNLDTMRPDVRDGLMKEQGRIVMGMRDHAEVVTLATAFEDRMKATAPELYKTLSETLALHTATALVAAANAQRAWLARRAHSK